MKIVVLNGTEVKGCTYHIKACFLDELREGNEITEFYLPRDLPRFCCGCKTCFFKSDTLCPHSEFTMPIWRAIVESDLLVFATPVYALRVPGQMKALLDHFACHWMVHRPDKAMFTKRAVILTNSIGAPNSAAQKEIAASLTLLGVSHIRRLGFGLMEGVAWDELSNKRRAKIEDSAKKIAKKYKALIPARRSLYVSLLWLASKLMHRAVLKKELTPSADNQYWIDNGWIKQPTLQD